MEMEILIMLYILNQEFYREELCVLEDLIKTTVIDLQVSLEEIFGGRPEGQRFGQPPGGQIFGLPPRRATLWTAMMKIDNK
jgi:hypothetical protein